MIGKTINNYVIERKLGDGGMGEVYYAKHNKVDREVAIKVLHSHLFFNESIHNRFKNEANALIKLNHPGIVKIFDYVEQENFACLIMEYINGYTLDVYISQVSGPLPNAKAISIICSVLDAVQYAHDNNVYHRDIKPSNIMIGKDNNKVLIMDFGIAKLTDSKNFKTTHANTQLGTPFYMSPEQIKGMPYSRKSDIYSLGVTLFEMVTGKCPYHEITSLFELQSKIVNEPLPDTNDYYPDVSFQIKNAIAIATQKNPDFRFQDCNEFKKSLLDKDTPLILPSSKPAIARQTKKMDNLPAYIAVGLILVAIIIIASVISGNKKGTGKDTNSAQPLDTMSTFIKNQNLNEMNAWLIKTEKESKIDIPASIEEALKRNIESLDHKMLTNELISICNPYLDSTIHNLNLAKMNTYLTQKEKETNIVLTSKQTEELKEKIRAFDNQITNEQLISTCKPYFVEMIKVISDDQLENDFWLILEDKVSLCRIVFEDRSQISSLSDFKKVNKKFPSNNKPEEITITIKFKINPKDDESDRVNCSETLNYSKSGNEYILNK